MSVSCDGLRRPSESAFHIFLLMGSYWLLLTQTDARVVSFTTSSASRRPQRQAGDARGREQSANCQSASVRVRHTHTHRRAIPCARRAGHRAGSGLLHHMCREPRTGRLGGTLGRTGSGIRDRGGPEGPVPRLGRGGRNVSSPVWPHPLWQCGPGRCPCSCGGAGGAPPRVPLVSPRPPSADPLMSLPAHRQGSRLVLCLGVLVTESVLPYVGLWESTVSSRVCVGDSCFRGIGSSPCSRLLGHKGSQPLLIILLISVKLIIMFLNPSLTSVIWFFSPVL